MCLNNIVDIGPADLHVC